MIMEKEIEKRLKEEIAHLKRTLSSKSLEITKLEKNNLFFETLFDGINEEIMVIDPSFSIIDVNRTFLEHYGLKKEDTIGKKCHKITYQSEEPCDFGKEFCPIEKARKTGQKMEVIQFLKGKKGHSKEVVRILYPLQQKKGMSECFAEISLDVTGDRDLIRKLKASEKKFSTILDTATDAIISIDEHHKIVLFNNAAERIFGYSRDEVFGKNLNLLIPPRYQDHSRFVKRFLKTKTPKVMGKTLSLTALRKGGEEFPIELGVSYNEIDGIITFTAIIRDVSSQNKLERKLLQSERLAAVGQTVAHVAHEIRNPLMIIGGFSQQIRKSLSDEKAIQKLDLIFDEIIRLERLVANLGDFTKQYKLVKRPADINSVIRDVLKILAEIYPSERYFFELDLSPDLGEINCDPDKLKQVYMNIIANGIEAMEDGGTIKISTLRGNDAVEVRISDEGIGISEGDLLHIFEPFYTTRKSGSGLGLSISYKIVEVHNGDIQAVSIPGQGTTFVIRLPLE